MPWITVKVVSPTYLVLNSFHLPKKTSARNVTVDKYLADDT